MLMRVFALVLTQLKSLIDSSVSNTNFETNSISTKSFYNLSTLFDQNYSTNSAYEINSTLKDLYSTDALFKINQLFTANDSKSIDLGEILNTFTSIGGSSKINITELINILENRTFQLDLKSDSSLPTQLLESSNLDINNCVSNCSNQGFCKLNSQNRNQFECLCVSNFTGSKCELDKRLCSQNPCLNSIKCDDILKPTKLPSTYEYDFKCHCKSDLFYGKRCESKINLCQNETCSGNGICKVIQTGQDGLNETIKCECFGLNDFEGEKCETKSTKRKTIETTIKTTAWIAISSVILFYSFIFVMDFHKFLTRKEKNVVSNKTTSKKT